MVHEELESAITQLGKAADLDPADRNRIEELRSSLKLIERPDGLGGSSAKEIHQSYRELLAQMDALISDLENHSR